jgi:hypothetical protein
VCPIETNRDRLAGAVREPCRSTSIEPPSSGQVERVVNSACRRYEEVFAEQVMARLGPTVCARLGEPLERPHVLAELKAGPGPLGLDTLLTKITKLATARSLGLGEAVFTETSDQRLGEYHRLFGLHLIGREKTAEGIRFRLRAEPGVEVQVRDSCTLSGTSRRAQLSPVGRHERGAEGRRAVRRARHSRSGRPPRDRAHQRRAVRRARPAARAEACPDGRRTGGGIRGALFDEMPAGDEGGARTSRLIVRIIGDPAKEMRNWTGPARPRARSAIATWRPSGAHCPAFPRRSCGSG